MGLESWLRELLLRLKFVVTRIKQSPLSIIGALIVIFFFIIALLAPVIAPSVMRDPFMMWRDSARQEARPPGSPILPDLAGKLALAKGYPSHILGSIEGWDIYYGCIWGTVTAFRVGFLAFFGALALGFVIGAVASCFGGFIDELLMKFNDILFAFSLLLAMLLVLALPFRLTIDLGFFVFAFLVPIAIVIIAHYGFKFSSSWSVAGGFLSFVYILLFSIIFQFSRLYPLNLMLNSLDKVVLALIIVGSPIYARIFRGEILRMKHEKFVNAAEAVGFSNIGVIVKRIVPDLKYSTLIMPFLGIGPIVLFASILSFLGIGAPLGYADWGYLISLSQNYIWAEVTNPWKNWYTFVIPGLFLFTFVLGWILLSNAFRDILVLSQENNSKSQVVRERKNT